MSSQIINRKINNTHKKPVRMNKTNAMGHIGDYKIIKKIQSGSQATVVIAEDSNQKQFAIKLFKHKKIFKRELHFLQAIGKQSNIVQMHEVLKNTEMKIYKNNQTQNINAIVMSLGKIDLYGVLKKIERFTEETARHLFKKLFIAINHCHSKKIAHCDIKLENIIFDGAGEIQIIDFGLGQDIQGQGMGSYSQYLGTFGYMSPEIHKSDFFDVCSADYFALAVILFIMVIGSPPFGQTNPNDEHYKLLTSDPISFGDFMESINPTTPEFKDFVLKMLSEKASQRLSYNEIISHPWFNMKTSSARAATEELNTKLYQSYINRKNSQ